MCGCLFVWGQLEVYLVSCPFLWIQRRPLASSVYSDGNVLLVFTLCHAQVTISKSFVKFINLPDKEHEDLTLLTHISTGSWRFAIETRGIKRRLRSIPIAQTFEQLDCFIEVRLRLPSPSSFSPAMMNFHVHDETALLALTFKRSLSW